MKDSVSETLVGGETVFYGPRNALVAEVLVFSASFMLCVVIPPFLPYFNPLHQMGRRGKNNCFMLPAKSIITIKGEKNPKIGSVKMKKESQLNLKISILARMLLFQSLLVANRAIKR